MTATQTHVRRRSRVSIQILPETREGEEDDAFDEKGSEIEATDETHLLSARRDHFHMPAGLAVGGGQQDGEGNARRKPWRGIAVLTAVAAASGLATATLLLLCRPGTDTVANMVEQ